MWTGVNKRHFPRADYQCLITIGADSSKKQISAQTENIGIGGICMGLDTDIGKFSEVNIELTLKDKRPPVKCRGHAVWIVKRSMIENLKPSAKFDTGIEFANLMEEDKKRIEKIVAEITKNQ